MSASSSWCVAKKCNNIMEKRHFFLFPKEHDRWLQWIHACKRNDLEVMGPEYAHRNYRLCHLHFEERWYKIGKSRARLDPDAVPTKFFEENNTHVIKALKEDVGNIIEKDCQQEETSSVFQLSKVMLVVNTDGEIVCKPRISSNVHLAALQETPKVSQEKIREKKLKERKEKLQEEIRNKKLKEQNFKLKAENKMLHEQIRWLEKKIQNLENTKTMSVSEAPVEKSDHSEALVGKTPKDVEANRLADCDTSTASIKKETEIKQESETTSDLDTVYGTYDETTNSITIMYPGEENDGCVSIQECVQEVVSSNENSVCGHATDDAVHLTVPSLGIQLRYPAQFLPAYTNSMSPVMSDVDSCGISSTKQLRQFIGRWIRVS